MKHVFRRADGAPIWFAGLLHRCAAGTADELSSFTILTGPSAGHLSDHHDHAPLTLEPEEWSAWLDPAQLLAAVRPDGFQVELA